MTDPGMPSAMQTGTDAPVVRGGGRVTGTDALARELMTMGVPCAVEARGTLAVVVVEADRYAGSATLLEPLEARDRVLRAAREVGFTHVALELREEDN